MTLVLESQTRGEHAELRAIDYDAYRARAFVERKQARADAVRSVARYFKRTGLMIRAATAFAVLAGAIFLAFGPADAAPNSPSSCQKRYQACQQRCEGRSPSGNAGADMLIACITRTCNKQFDHCMRNASTGGGGKLETPGGTHNPRPDQAGAAQISDAKPLPNPLTSTTNNSSPLGGGILGDGNGMGGNGPSATGSPAGGMPKTPPAAPPVILR